MLFYSYILYLTSYYMIEKHMLFSIKIVFILRYLIKNLAFYIKCRILTQKITL